MVNMKRPVIHVSIDQDILHDLMPLVSSHIALNSDQSQVAFPFFWK